jgi:hypothetical protein
VSGIGNTIETDLVGERIEIQKATWSSTDSKIKVIGRGRCRAVTAKDGVMILWLEIVDDDDARGWDIGWLRASLSIGDVIRIATDDGHATFFLRLLKEG